MNIQCTAKLEFLQQQAVGRRVSESLPKHNYQRTKLRSMQEDTKITRAPCRTRISNTIPRAKKVGDLTTADHKVLKEDCESRNSHRYVVIVPDSATQWLQTLSGKTKTSRETEKSSRKLLEPKENYTDNALEFGKVCEMYTSDTSAIWSGLRLVGSFHGVCCCYLPTVEVLSSDGKTPHERRFGDSFCGPVI